MAAVLVLSSLTFLTLASCKTSEDLAPERGPGGGPGSLGRGGHGGTSSAGGQAGTGGLDGGGGAGGAGGAPTDVACQTNADCAAGSVCFVAAFLGPPGCGSGAAGRCVEYQRSGCSTDTAAPDACDCLGPSYASACAALVGATPTEGVGLTCGGATGRVSDYTSPTSCFTCVLEACQIVGVAHPAQTRVDDGVGFPCGDGCNTCWCTPQGAVATEVACPFGGNGGNGGGGGPGGNGGAPAGSAGGRAGGGGQGGV